MHGQPGTVNVSGNTYEFIAPYFDCVYRGKIQTKHKGMLDMYYVKGIKPELSENQEGIIPNEDFWKIVDLHLYSSINYMKAERHIMKILEDTLSPKLLYHSINHTIDVTQAVERLALMEGITDEDLFLLKSAATYHDAGFVEQYDKNEEIGIRMARDILPRYGYTTVQLDVIDGLIKSTEIPQSPKTHLEQIMCDADLDYLGRDDFHVIADYLRRELREHGKLNSDRLWDEIQIKFLNQHTYFTKSAIKLRQEKKEKHIREIEERYARNEYKD
jgi:predicted metal-dependent HD superfamily phosphohydrolase